MLIEERKKNRQLPHFYIQYEEGDVYVTPSYFTVPPQRPFVFTLAGHENHGKTALFTAFQKRKTEGARATLSLQLGSAQIDPNIIDRIVSARPELYTESRSTPGFFTLIDTPGHESCYEMRIHGIRASDIVLLTISVEEGVQCGTQEVIEIAKEFRKKIIVLVTKIDWRGTCGDQARVLMGIVRELRGIGLDVHPMTLCPVSPQEVYRKIPSMSTPLLCISATEANVFTTALEVILCYAYRLIKVTRDQLLPREEETHDKCVQALIVGSFRDQATGELACQVIVRNGTLRLGMWFIADFNFGQVTKITDMNGKTLTSASAGFPATVYGLKMCGCPGVGTHIIVTRTAYMAKETAAFRAQLSWYIQHFTKLSHLLRPKDMETHFHHIGNFGQITDDRSIEYRLCHGHTQVSRDMNESGTTKAETDHEEMPCSSLVTSPSGSIHDKNIESIQSVTKSIEATSCIKNPAIEFRYVLLAESWHVVKLLVRELHKCSTKNARVIPVATFVGSMREDVVKTAAQGRASTVFSFDVVCRDAHSDWYANRKGVMIKKFVSLNEIVGYTQKVINSLHRNWNIEGDALEKQSFASSFIPRF